ncbi:MAG: hypothetical protein DMF23_15430 [Verrucomicrobia bacterium]|nr:MAG: hypothetical protein DMF23_15430 [Verrucomicrobiota bacterium]
MLKTRRSVSLQFAALTLLSILLACCATPKDLQHHVIISVKDQKLALLDRETLVAIYPKIGDNAPLGTVFKDRRRTGEIVLPNAPGRDPIVTRILWLRGREAQNANAFGRYIYIHGTPEDRNLGLPVSYGCVRMKSEDVIKLYDIVGTGAQVTIVDAPLATVVPAAAGETQIVSTGNGGIIVR